MSMRPKRHRIRPASVHNLRQLRQDSTNPERLLWSRLRNEQLLGWKFRRQSAIDRYIVDFYCAQARLVIEIDGMSHDDRRAYDAERTSTLIALGLRVVRYTNDDVIRDLEAVTEDIARHLPR